MARRAPSSRLAGALFETTLRYPLGILVGSIALVVFESLLLSEPSPLLARLDASDQVELYKQVGPIAGTALGFLIASVAILVSLDPQRPIVCRLRRGESFALLITNLLAACLWLLLLAILSLLGWAAHNGVGSTALFQSIYEAVAYAATIELVLGGFFFGLVTYKVARYE